MADCEKCGQPHDPKRCKGHKNLREDPADRDSRIVGTRPCLLYPVKGSTVCIAHGGATKTTRAKAAERVAEEKAQTHTGRMPNPAVAERRAEALKMRRDGARYEDIAAALGYVHRGAAVQDVQRALATMVGEAAEELRALEVQRLDMMWRAALEVLRRQHITVSNGKIITLDGEPVEDDGPVLQAIDRLLRIQERRSKLLGLDAPTKHEVVSLDAIDAEIRRLNDEIARADELERTEADETAGAETST